MHSFVFDGDENADFITGLGFRFSVPLSAQLHDRHIRFAGEGAGVLGEAVRGITGLRRDPGAAARARADRRHVDARIRRRGTSA